MASEKLLNVILNGLENEALILLNQRENLPNYTFVLAAPPEMRIDINMELESHGGKTFLMLAAQRNLLRVVKELIRQGANVYAGDYGNNTVIDYAQKDSQVYALLLQHGAKHSHPGCYLGNS